MKKNKVLFAIGLLLVVGQTQTGQGGEAVPAVFREEINVLGSEGGRTGYAMTEVPAMTREKFVERWAQPTKQNLTPKQEVELKKLEQQRDAIYKELDAVWHKRETMASTRFNQVPSKLQRAALNVLAKGSAADMHKLVQLGLDVNMPIREYTLLMQTSDREMMKCLIEECHADINEVVWQPRWGHYVTALDCSNWASFQSKEEAAIQAKVSAYLKSKGAKTAGELGFWSDYNGDYVLSSEDESIISFRNTVAALNSKLATVWSQIEKLTGENPFRFRGIFRGPVERGPVMMGPERPRPVLIQSLISYLVDHFNADRKPVEALLMLLDQLVKSDFFEQLTFEQQREFLTMVTRAALNPVEIVRK